MPLPPKKPRASGPHTAGVVQVPVAVIPPGADLGLDGVYLERYNDAVKHIRVEIRPATPAWAMEVLDKRNNRNRPWSSGWERLRDIMLRWAWWINGETVVFDREDELINGQHRLWAIIEAGLVVPLLVVYGVDPGAFSSFDQASRRNAATIVGLLGHEHRATLGSALTWQLALDENRLGRLSRATIPNDVVPAMLASHPELAESAHFAASNQNRLIPPGLLTFLYSQFRAIDVKLCDQFFERVIDGVGVEKVSWEFLLRRRLEELIGRRDELTQTMIAALVIKAFNRVRAGTRPSENGALVWRDAEAFPVLGGETVS